MPKLGHIWMLYLVLQAIQLELNGKSTELVRLQGLKKIKLVLFDVDGVLTDGSVIYSDNGAETKVFHVKDGLGIRLLMKAGIEVGIVTGRASEALRHRCRNLGIRHVYDDVRDKASALEQILKKIRVSAPEIAFVGDPSLSPKRVRFPLPHSGASFGTSPLRTSDHRARSVLACRRVVPWNPV